MNVSINLSVPVGVGRREGFHLGDYPTLVPGEGPLSPHARQRTLCSLVVINTKISFSARGADLVLE